MKFIWEEDDIVCGRIVCKASQIDCEPNGNSAKWTHKIGFAADHPSKKHYILIAMTDGMTGEPMTLKEIVDRLNKGNGVDHYAPMPHKQFIRTMEYLEGCYDTLSVFSKRYTEKQ